MAGLRTYLLLGTDGAIIGRYHTGSDGPANSIEVGKDVILSKMEVSLVEMNKKWDRGKKELVDLSKEEKNIKKGITGVTLPRII